MDSRTVQYYDDNAEAIFARYQGAGIGVARYFKLEAFLAFMDDHPIHMIQWRNLNYDPIRYWKAMDAAAPLGEPIGMETLIQGIRSSCPNLKFGYFNPPKEKFQSFRQPPS